MLLSEPKSNYINRFAGKQKSKVIFTNEIIGDEDLQIKRRLHRPAAEGMETPQPSHLVEKPSILEYEAGLNQNMSPVASPLRKYSSIHDISGAAKLASSWQAIGSEVSSATDASHVSYLQGEVKSLCDMTDNLQSKMVLLEEQNSRLTEEKLKISSHLGLQNQVNLELKRLLVASVGEDLQGRFEKLTLDKAQLETQFQHVSSQLQGDMEEIERLHIQCDLWRSKFLASRVMVDELASWKSTLYFKYKESQTALQKLLEEHYQLRALSSAIYRQLVTATESLGCKDTSLDLQDPSNCTTFELSMLNHDMLTGICDVLRPHEQTVSDAPNPRISIIPNETGGVLSNGEQLAQKTLLDPDVETSELKRLRRDYLSHSRTSHFLSTNYHALYNCCENCTGPIEII